MCFRRLVRFCASRVVIGGIGLAGIVSGPSVNAQGIQASGVEPLQFGAVDYKSTQNVKATQMTEEATQFWSWSVNAGYTSEYIFRGTNLMPDSDGGVFATMNVSKWGFTLGIYGIHQIGTAKANAFSIGEGGGGGSTGTFLTSAGDNLVGPGGLPETGGPNLFFTGTMSPVTTQTRFNEIDLYLSYTHELGPIDITIGNIAFFIDRRAQTQITTSGTFVDGVFVNGVLTDPNGDAHMYHVNGDTVNIPTVGNETFDRIYVAVSAPRLFHSNVFNIVPKIYYYQTVLNDGQDPFENVGKVIVAHDLSPAIPTAELPEHVLAINGLSERNSTLGGYLEGRIDANFNLGDRVRVQPYGLISYSFHDRTEPSDVSGPFVEKNFVRARSLVGFNNAQVGVKVPILLWSGTGNASGSFAPAEAVFSFAPFGAYSYHISTPPIGTDRNEVWGGAQFELTF
jgi:hypothetical protein